MVTVPFERKVYLYVKSNGYRPETFERAVLVHDESKGNGYDGSVSKSQTWRCQIAEPYMNTVPSVGDFISDGIIPPTKKALLMAQNEGRAFEIKSVKDRRDGFGAGIHPYGSVVEVTS